MRKLLSALQAWLRRRTSARYRQIAASSGYAAESSAAAAEARAAALEVYAQGLQRELAEARTEWAKALRQVGALRAQLQAEQAGGLVVLERLDLACAALGFWRLEAEQAQAELRYLRETLSMGVRRPVVQA